MTDLHLVYTNYGDDFGWGLSSPQIPELAGGRNTLDELVAATGDILAVAGIDDGRHMWMHEQHLYVDPTGDEYLLRFAHMDGDEAGNAARVRCAELVLSAVEDGFADDKKARQPKLVTTERLIVAALESDTLGWCLDQLDEGAGAVFAQQIADDATQSVALGTGIPGDVTWEMEELGLTRDSTVSEMFDAVYTWEAHHLAGSVNHEHRAIVPL